MTKEQPTLCANAINDIAYVCKKTDFGEIKSLYDAEYRNPSHKNIGWVTKENKLIAFEDAILEKATSIKFSTLTKEALTQYKTDSVVLVIDSEQADSLLFKLNPPVVYSIEDIVSKNIYIVKEEYRVDMTLYIDDEDDVNYYFLCLDLVKKRFPKNKSDVPPFLNCVMWEGDSKNYTIIGNTVFLSTGDAIDSDGFIGAKYTENGEVYAFTKDEGKYIDCVDSNDTGIIEYHDRSNKTIELSDYLLLRMTDENNKVLDDFVILGTGLFDSKKGEYVIYEGVKVKMVSTQIMNMGDGKYLLEDNGYDGEYILGRYSNEKAYIEYSSYNEEEEQ